MSADNAVKAAVIDVELDKQEYRRLVNCTSFLMVLDGEVSVLNKARLLDFHSHGGDCLKHFEIASQMTADFFILLEHGNDTLCKVGDLIVALSWCVDNDISLISMSIGTTEYYDSEKFDDVISRINEAGVCAIAGANNNRSLSYPACLREILGVCIDYTYETVRDYFAYIDNPLDGVNIVLNPNICSDLLIDSNSMATAYFSGVIAKAIKNKETTPRSVRSWLVNNAERFSNTVLYEYTFSAIALEASDDVIVIGVEGLSSNAHVAEYCRELKKIFRDEEYHCTIIFSCGEILLTSNFSKYEFVQPMREMCSYGEYISLITKLCKPNLMLTDLNENGCELDAVICLENNQTTYGKKLVVAIKDDFPGKVFKRIEKHFNPESR